MIKEKIMIIGAGDFQFPLIKKAAEKYNVVLVAPVIDDVFEPYIYEKLLIDVREKEKILEFAVKQKIDGVITDQTDIAVRSVAYVAEKMNLPGIGYSTGCLFTDKSLMRKRMVELGIPCLPNKTVHSLDEALSYYEELGGDVIIKPLDTQGSRGVQACHNREELIEKFSESQRWSSDKSVIVERLATGREFVVEGIAYDYHFENLICGDTLYFDIPDAYAAKSRIFPSDCETELYNRVLELNRRIITGFGLKQGICHSEYIMDGDQIYLMETAARGGGVFISSDLISLSTGVCTEDFLLNIATNQQDELPEILSQQCCCGYMAFYVPVGTIFSIEGLDFIKSLNFVHHHQLDHLRVGMTIDKKHTDKTSRLAIIVSGTDRNELMENMQFIKKHLKVNVKTQSGIQGLIWG